MLVRLCQNYDKDFPKIRLSATREFLLANKTFSVSELSTLVSQPASFLNLALRLVRSLHPSIAPSRESSGSDSRRATANPTRPVWRTYSCQRVWCDAS